MITNGILLDSQCVKKLIKNRLDVVIVSIDSVSPERYSDIRAGIDLTIVLENLRSIKRISGELYLKPPEIGLEFVAMKLNIAELPELKRLALSIGASFIVVTDLLPYTEDMKGEVLYGLRAPSAFRPRRTRYTPHISLPKMDLKRETYDALYPLVRFSRNLSLLQNKWSTRIQHTVVS